MSLQSIRNHDRLNTAETSRRQKSFAQPGNRARPQFGTPFASSPPLPVFLCGRAVEHAPVAEVEGVADRADDASDEGGNQEKLHCVQKYLRVFCLWISAEIQDQITYLVMKTLVRKARPSYASLQ